MASVSDNFGGVTNLTLLVNVTQPQIENTKDQNNLLITLKSFQISDDEILKLTIFAKSYISYETEDFTNVDMYIIERLSYYLE